MNANEYQQQAARTLIDGPDFSLTDTEFMTVWVALGLAGEAGEVAELVKKGLLHRHGLDLQKLHKELGDVCWYIAALCTECGFDLGDVLNANIAKLQTRYPNGYRAADSIARIDTTIHSTESASK